LQQNDTPSEQNDELIIIMVNIIIFYI